MLKVSMHGCMSEGTRICCTPALSAMERPAPAPHSIWPSHLPCMPVSIHACEGRRYEEQPPLLASLCPDHRANCLLDRGASAGRFETRCRSIPMQTSVCAPEAGVASLPGAHTCMLPMHRVRCPPRMQGRPALATRRPGTAWSACARCRAGGMHA